MVHLLNKQISATMVNFKARRRRSSSLMYTEPMESMEHISDQAALPNLNAEWVNSKGLHFFTIYALRTWRMRELTSFRSMDHTFRTYHLP